MDTVATGARGSRRGSQDETPFPIELEIVARRKRVVHREGRSQDETAPFPLEFEVVARRAQHGQDETSPFLLEFNVVLPDGQPAFVRTARPPRARGSRRSTPRALPVLKWHGVNASPELREYAARIASGESLPPYQGPILANGELPRVRPAAPSPVRRGQHATTSQPADDSKATVKFALALMVMTALVVASAVLGDDTQLRGVGQAISRWVTGRDSSFETLRPAQAVKPAAVKSSTPRH